MPVFIYSSAKFLISNFAKNILSTFHSRKIHSFFIIVHIFHYFFSLVYICLVGQWNGQNLNAAYLKVF